MEAQADDEFVGTKGLVRKVDLVKAILATLYSLGYSRAVECLEKESKISLHSPFLRYFMEQISDGRWDQSLVTLGNLGLTESVIKDASFEIKKQKIFKFLDEKADEDALQTLREEISPLGIEQSRIRDLSMHVMSHRPIEGDNVKKSIDKYAKELLLRLQAVLPPSVMIPENRLVKLLELAIELQITSCPYHNTPATDGSLFIDHQCQRTNLPFQTVQVLREHEGQVWSLKFSHNGKFLASSDSKFSTIIWRIDEDGVFHFGCRLVGHEATVCSISWSPDDKLLLTCGEREKVILWNAQDGTNLHVVSSMEFDMLSCEWSPDGKCFYCGQADRNDIRGFMDRIIKVDLETKQQSDMVLSPHKWAVHNLVITSDDLGVTDDRKDCIVVCESDTIRLYQWGKGQRFTRSETGTIVSFTVSDDRKYLLVSLLNDEIHLWEIVDGGDYLKFLESYNGHRNSRYVVSSCFGGLDQGFIASGSEDSQVFIWNRKSTEIVNMLQGHTGVVNSVSWNPTNNYVLASASDDGTIHIWGVTPPVQVDN